MGGGVRGTRVVPFIEGFGVINIGVVEIIINTCSLGNIGIIWFLEVVRAILFSGSILQLGGVVVVVVVVVRVVVVVGGDDDVVCFCFYCCCR